MPAYVVAMGDALLLEGFTWAPVHAIVQRPDYRVWVFRTAHAARRVIASYGGGPSRMAYIRIWPDRRT